MYSLLANTVLVIHAAFIMFVVLTVPCIYIGKALNWRWVRLYWLRVTHVIGICMVAAQAWAGVICPLTTLEMWLRDKGGLATYADSFISHWLQRLIYWDLPAWIFVVIYSFFALLIFLTWHVVPPSKNTTSSAA
ncbi:MAG: DUF2784 domain-containing protein [Gammaproteobacteria bacterium]|nr:DUF2784 domain-containing protein [Gammaproteobacteria bacterium]